MSDAAAKKAPKKPADHPKYAEMVTSAIASLKERNGSSRQAIAKYIKANYKVSDSADVHIKLALKRMAEKGTLVHTKGVGASGSFKLNKAVKEEKPKKKPVVKKPAPKKPAAKKPAAKKTKKPAKKATKAKGSPKKGKKPAGDKAKKPAAKKPAAGKKPTAKKAGAKKPAAKKTTTKKPVAKKSNKKTAKK